MNKSQIIGVKMFMALSLVSRRAFLLSGAVCQGFTLFGNEEPSPFVEADKPIFARGEAIRFWVGVKALGWITPEKQKTGVLHIIRPDGVHESQLHSWPISGPGNVSWKGGASLGNSPVVLGRYRLWFEWDQKQSPEAELTVCEWDLQDRIVTRWLFEGDDFHHAAAVLTVANQTDQVLRFARLGITGSEVWIECHQDGPYPWGQTGPYPEKELLPDEEYFTSVDADEARWQNLDRVPLVTVEPHSLFSQPLSLAKVSLPFPVTTPKVEIGTVLTVFVGEVGDAMSALYLVRLAVHGGRRFS